VLEFLEGEAALEELEAFFEKRNRIYGSCGVGVGYGFDNASEDLGSVAEDVSRCLVDGRGRMYNSTSELSCFKANAYRLDSNAVFRRSSNEPGSCASIFGCCVSSYWTRALLPVSCWRFLRDRRLTYYKQGRKRLEIS
jgi:hypothetical protein